MKHILDSIFKYSLAKKTEGVVEDPQTKLPAINANIPQTNIPEPSTSEENPAVNPASKQQIDAVKANKVESKKPEWELESALKNIEIAEFHLEKAKNENYIKEMDDIEKDKMNAVNTAMTAMKQTISEMIQAWKV